MRPFTFHLAPTGQRFQLPNEICLHLWTGANFCKDIHGVQMMQLHDFGDTLTLRLAPA